MTGIAVGVTVRRSAVRGRTSTTRTVPSVPGPCPTGECRPARHGLYGDELRVRAWLWRRFGVGVDERSGGMA
ncbi:hypothetical protein I5Q34_26815 [Streptomyces sp. AV19]|uniref:hypothetical protein n=1 Tax=Streptomyces sp. AV19 TaxID=2793068 RepID=UPI0018FE397E|nr:hypothetical protein [Streptomyces sp. AV19]MBH1937839.1 hypothetical protein [Streptomyces sp. AV19]MDG4537117.1 hypothetical protein [Streptomyces sp. AV19]